MNILPYKLSSFSGLLGCTVDDSRGRGSIQSKVPYEFLLGTAEVYKNIIFIWFCVFVNFLMVIGLEWGESRFRYCCPYFLKFHRAPNYILILSIFSWNFPQIFLTRITAFTLISCFILWEIHIKKFGSFDRKTCSKVISVVREIFNDL